MVGGLRGWVSIWILEWKEKLVCCVALFLSGSPQDPEDETSYLGFRYFFKKSIAELCPKLDYRGFNWFLAQKCQNRGLNGLFRKKTQTYPP